MFKCKCIFCGKTFSAKRSTAKFCSDAHRKSYARQLKKKGEEVTKMVVKNVKNAKEEKTTVKASFKPVDKSFVPNWQRLGYKSKEEAWGYVIDCLFKNKQKILNAGITDEVTFTYQNHIIELRKK